MQQEGLLQRGAMPARPPQEGQTDASQGEAASPEEQKAYEVALEAVSEILHVKDESYNSIMKMLGSGAPADSAVQVSAMVLAEVDGQLNLPEAVILELVSDILDQVLELGAEAGYFNLQDKEIQQIYVVLLKEIMDAYGFDEEDVTGVIDGMSEQELNSSVDMVAEVA